ncbi:MAG: APC family permease [Hyphomicrobiales bacterium]
MAHAAAPDRGSMGLFSVAAIGIGSMVGAGIFALLGQAAVAAGRDVYLSFIIAGVIAFLSGISYAKLAVRYPVNGGIVEYFSRAFPSPLVARALSLLYLLTLVVTVAIVAKAFGKYATRLVIGNDVSSFLSDCFAAGIVILLALLNLVGDKAVGRAELLLVSVKLGILALLMAAGLPSIDPGLIAQGPEVTTQALISSVGLTFFAYAGFGMMANAAANVASPGTTLPRAIFLAIALVIVLYISLAVVVLGNLPAEKLVKYADTAVAEAAKPVLGHLGFVAVSVGALIATASAMNATLYSLLNLGRALAERDPDGSAFARWLLGSTGGYATLVAAIVVIIFFFNLSAIANVAGGAFLLAYLAVFAAHWRLIGETGGSKLLILAGAALMVLVLVVMFVQLTQVQPDAVELFSGLLGICALLAWLMQGRSAARA